MQPILYLLAVLSLTYAHPTPQPPQPCNALIEETPWHISNINVFNAAAASPSGSSVSFSVADTNPGLEFETTCGISMPAGTGARPEEAGGWHPCMNGRVAFLYTPGNIHVKRSYLDDCLGSPPWNVGIFFGNANTNFQVSSATGGEVWSQTDMIMPITSQSS